MEWNSPPGPMQFLVATAVNLACNECIVDTVQSIKRLHADVGKAFSDMRS